MNRFAIPSAPQALVHVAPTLPEYTNRFRQALQLDAKIRAPIEVASFVGLSSAEPLPDRSTAEWDDIDLLDEPNVIGCARAVDAATLSLGASARYELRTRLRDAAVRVLEWYDPTRGPVERLAYSELFRARRGFLQCHGAKRLWAEFRDQCQREAALYDDAVREAYIRWWQRRITALQRKLSWRVPGLMPEDLVGELLVRLIAALDSGDQTPFAYGGSPGIEGTFSFLVREKNFLRRRKRIHEVVLPEGLSALHDRTPTGEELVMAKEQREQAEAVLTRAERRLRPRQRRYFDAVLEDAREHEYVSEVRIAERLGVHKSTVSRAVHTVVDALTKSGAGEVLEGLKPDAPRAKRRQWRSERKAEPLRFEPSPGATNAPRPRVPQPPWLDEFNLVRIKETGEEGIVRRVDESIVGPLYGVRCNGVERTNLPRGALEYQGEVVAPF